MISELELELMTIIKSLEWCTDLPSVDSPRKRQISLANGNICFLLFSLEEQSHTWYFNLYLEFKCKRPEFKLCCGKLQVEINREQFRLSLDSKIFELSEPGKKEIWYISRNDLENKLPSTCMEGTLMKFRFSFDDRAEPILKNHEDVDDKCVQTGSYLNPDLAIESVSEDFFRLLDSGPNHDAEIRCGEHSIKAHKIVLCSRSEVLSAMLKSDMQEGRTGVIEIQDMDISYVQDFIRYLYTGTMPELTFDKAKVLYEAGDKYAVRSLMLRCSEYLQDNLSSGNAFQCFALADAHSDEKLKDSVIAYILEKKMYLQEESWLPFCKSYPEAALEVYRLSYKNVAETKEK